VPSFAALLALMLLAGAYFYALSETGLLGPDEPRYASIGREMARSGDWITPRLWGQPWFEKPALLYWLVAAGHAAGLEDEWAARSPVTLLSLCILAWFWWGLRRLAGGDAAFVSTVILATTAGWMAFSNVAATDLPLAATFSAALLSGILALETGWSPGWPFLGVFLGMALLAKGLVGGVLILPFAWFARAQWRRLLVAGCIAGLVASVWYVPMFLRHGAAFLDEFFMRHHFVRFATEELQHAQPFWFYVPVLLAGLFPWTAALLVAAWQWREILALPRWARIFLWVAAAGFLFFSASTNKLPGYVLPLLPPLCAVLGYWLSETSACHRVLFWCAVPLGLLPAIAAALPQALREGVGSLEWQGIPWMYGAASLVFGVIVWWLAVSSRSAHAVALVGMLALLSVVYLKLQTFPVLDRLVSARDLYRRIQPLEREVCVGELHRSLRYGLNYYSGLPLPDCDASPRRVRVNQEAGRLPALEVESTPPR
jgi:4-amino-4-deoxy-L-arabinose transferase-like glycosyltransferase